MVQTINQQLKQVMIALAQSLSLNRYSSGYFVDISHSNSVARPPHGCYQCFQYGLLWFHISPYLQAAFIQIWESKVHRFLLVWLIQILHVNALASSFNTKTRKFSSPIDPVSPYKSPAVRFNGTQWVMNALTLQVYLQALQKIPQSLL